MKNWIEKIKEIESNTISKFEKWQNENKKLILSILENISKDMDDLFIQVNDSVINHESVMLAFKIKPSLFSYNPEDLYNKQEGIKGRIVENGGYISFSTTILGNITVWMKYPEIEDIMKNNNEYIDLGFIKQEELNEEFIMEMINKFFENIVLWKEGKLFDREPIGFRNR